MKEKRRMSIALTEAEKRAQRRREEQARREEKETEVSQTKPLTRDTRWVYKVHDNATVRKGERERERKSRTSSRLHSRKSGLIAPRNTFPPFQFEEITHDSRNCPLECALPSDSDKEFEN